VRLTAFTTLFPSPALREEGIFNNRDHMPIGQAGGVGNCDDDTTLCSLGNDLQFGVRVRFMYGAQHA